jgi:hypothetical protein
VAISRITIAIALCLTVLLIWAPVPPRADSESLSEIVYLTLEISESGVALIEWNTVEGTLKRPRQVNPHATIAYTAKSAAGATLWSGGLDDPRVVRIESYALDPSGTITPHLIHRDSAQFAIRIPYGIEIDRIEFARQSAEFKDGRVTASQTPLATIAWPSTRAGKRP